MPKQSNFPLRLPDDLRERIDAAAGAGARSVNAEIVARLYDSFAAEWDIAAGLAQFERVRGQPRDEAAADERDRLAAVQRYIGEEVGKGLAAAEQHFANRLAELVQRVAAAEAEIAELRRSRTKPRRPALSAVPDDMGRESA